jgi:hypothetical protein
MCEGVGLAAQTEKRGTAIAGKFYLGVICPAAIINDIPNWRR